MPTNKQAQYPEAVRRIAENEKLWVDAEYGSSQTAKFAGMKVIVFMPSMPKGDPRGRQWTFSVTGGRPRVRYFDSAMEARLAAVHEARELVMLAAAALGLATVEVKVLQ